MSTIRAVILDMDGLMLDTERVALEALRSAGCAFGIELTDDFLHSLVGVSVRDSRSLFLSEFGAQFPVDDFQKRSDSAYVLALEEGVPRKPGLGELLDFIESRTLPVGVATSTVSDVAMDKLARAGVLSRLHVVVCSDQVQRGKPHPDLYLEAARRLGITADRQCVAFEDSEPGIRSAHAAGLRTIMVPDRRPPTPEIRSMADAVVDSLHAARHQLHSWLSEDIFS